MVTLKPPPPTYKQGINDLLDSLASPSVSTFFDQMREIVALIEEHVAPGRSPLSAAHESIDCVEQQLLSIVALTKEYLGDQQEEIERLKRLLGSPRRHAGYSHDGYKTLTVTHFKNQIGDSPIAYNRNQPLIVVEWDCVICGKHNQRSQLPGAMPKYCQPPHGENLSSCQREARRQAVQRHRGKPEPL